MSIESALTWLTWQEILEENVRLRSVAFGPGDGGLDEHDRYQVAAVALYGQPFGFTWEDVRRIRQTAHLDDCMDYERTDLLGLADRIAALLPPRAPTEDGE